MSTQDNSAGVCSCTNIVHTHWGQTSEQWLQQIDFTYPTNVPAQPSHLPREQSNVGPKGVWEGKAEERLWL